MSPRATTALNYAAYQVGWFAVVLGATAGHAAAGALVATLLVAAHVAVADDRRSEARLVVMALVTGAVVEAWQLQAGSYRELAHMPPAPVPPIWLLLLWAQFATTFRYALRDVIATPRAAVAFGALGGPLAFTAGDRLGAVTLSTPLWPALLRLAVAWALALVWFAWATPRVAAGRGGYRTRW